VFVADNPALHLVIESEGPVGLGVTDPTGGIITPFTNTIPRATYTQGDFDGDGQPEDRVSIPQAVEGSYRIRVIADSSAAPTDPVTLHVSLNGITVPLADATVADLNGTELSFGNQGFVHGTSHMIPRGGVGSLATLNARLRHVPATAGPVLVRFTDGTNEALFDFGRIENLVLSGTSRIFKGKLNGFTTKFSFSRRVDGTGSIALYAKDGDLSMFTGTADVSMTVILQIGSDADMYFWRFKRQTNGQLVLK
jgi:hypothetical protein